jgi:DNA repair protein RadC
LEIRHDEALKVDPPALAEATDDARLFRSEERRWIANRAKFTSLVHSLPARHRQSLLTLCLGREFELLGTGILGRGKAGECGIKPMRVVSQAQRLGAIGFLLVHVDPARTSVPTEEEIMVTRETRRLGEDFDIPLLDHLILGRDQVRDVAA